jgi:hypothetical protein
VLRARLYYLLKFTPLGSRVLTLTRRSRVRTGCYLLIFFSFSEQMDTLVKPGLFSAVICPIR